MGARRFAPFCAGVLLVACASNTGTSSLQGSSSPSATSPGPRGSTASNGTSPSGSEAANLATSTTTSSADLAPRFAAGDLPTTEACSLGAPSVEGQITFVVASRLYAVAADGTLRCLADLEGRSPTWLSWSPDGDELLVGPDLLLRTDATLSNTGYFADNTNVRWSAPTGKALLAPKASTGQLIWRNAHNSADRIDVSFADSITNAAYHPAGKHIAAAGIGRDGQGPGVFVASNRGANAQRIGQLEPGTTATDVAFDMAGNSLVFIHKHADGGAQIHRYVFANNELLTLADLDVIPTDLTVSPIDDGDVAWRQTGPTQNSMARVLLAGADRAVTVNSTGGEHVTAPIGWLPGHRLLVSATSPGAASSEPFELWEWSPSKLSSVISGVTAAATRTIHGAYSELTIIPGSGFG